MRKLTEWAFIFSHFQSQTLYRHWYGHSCSEKSAIHMFNVIHMLNNRTFVWWSLTVTAPSSFDCYDLRWLLFELELILGPADTNWSCSYSTSTFCSMGWSVSQVWCVSLYGGAVAKMHTPCMEATAAYYHLGCFYSEICTVISQIL